MNGAAPMPIGMVRQLPISIGWWLGCLTGGVAAMFAIGASAKGTAKSDKASVNLVGHGGPVRAIASDPRSRRLLTGSFDYTMMLWQISEDGMARPLKRFDEHDSAVSAVAFLPDGQRALAGSDDGSVHLWDLRSGKRLHLFKGHTARVLGIAIGDGGQWVATASWDRSVRLWDLKELKSAHVLQGHNGPVNGVAFSADGAQVVSAGYDGTIRLWSSVTGEQRRVAYKNGWGINVIRRLGVSESYLFGALDGTAAIFDLSANKVVHKFEPHEKPVLSIAVLGKPGLVATGGGDGRISVYRQGDWKKIETYTNPFGPVWALAFAEEGARVYFGGLDDHVTAWQVVPRRKFDPVPSKFPRRFQVSGSDISLGERQFARKCSVCHTLTPDDANRAGPTLYRIFGRRAGTLAGYPYSKALKNIKLVWTPETLGKLFEMGPHEYTPGSKMPLQKITDPKKRSALIRYLEAATTAGKDRN